MNAFLSFCKQHSAAILTVLGVVGIAGTAVTAAVCAPKAIKAKEEAEELGADKTDVIKAVAKEYIPAIAVGAATTVCVISLSVVNQHKITALTGAYGLIRETFGKYRAAACDIYGEDADDKIMTKVAEKTYDVEEQWCTYPELGWEDSNDIREKFYIADADMFVDCSPHRIMEAEYHLNRTFSMTGTATLSQFLKFIGVEREDIPENIGWTVESGLMWVDFEHVHRKMENGVEYTEVSAPFQACYFDEYHNLVLDD